MTELIDGFAKVIERMTTRFNAQAALNKERCNEYDKRIASMNADHEAKMVEHRAAFGARTEADAKIIAGLRAEIVAERMAMQRDSLMSERDGLLTQVQDMRAEIERLRIEAAKCKAARDDLTQLHAKGKEAWSDVPNATQWVEEMRGNSEATHDTEAGKSAAESAVRTEPVAEGIKVGDLGEVFQATTRTLNSDVGITGCVSSIHLDPCHGGFLVKFDPSTQSRRSAGMQAFGLCDVRKVTT